jgi:WD40 repeat protein
MFMASRIFGTKLQLLVFTSIICTGTALAQRERILWSKPDTDPLLNVAFSNDGTILALCREDSNTSDFLNAADGSLIRSITATHNRINDSVFTLDDQYLIDGNGGGGETLTLNLWRVSDGVRLFRLGAHTNGTHSVDLSSDGQLLLTSGNSSRELKKWHVPDLRLIATFTNDDPESPGLPPEVDDSEFSPDDQLIGNSDIRGVKLRSAADGSLLVKIANAEIVSVAFSPDGTLIAGASPTERAIKIWSVPDGTLLKTLTVTTDFQFPRVTFTPNGAFIVAVYGSSNIAGAIQFWRVADGRSAAIFAKPNHVHDIAFSPEPGVFAYTQYSGGVTISFARFIQ